MGLGDAVGMWARGYEGGRAADGRRVTVYEAVDGRHERRVGGSPAWRNSNPGNIRPSRFNKEQIGEAWGFAVFASVEDGMRAMRDLLGRPLYARLSLEKAIYKYAPPADDNPSDAYAAYVSTKSGVGLGVVLGTLDELAMMRVISAMVAFERSVVGVVEQA